MPGIRVGCSGFPRPMGEYLATFDLVEVQRSFYKLPRLETALRWRQEAGHVTCVVDYCCTT